MRRWIVTLLFVLVAASSASAQWMPEIYYPNQNQVIMNMDLPAAEQYAPPEYQPAQGAWVVNQGLYFAGWAFNCNGQSIQSFKLMRWDPVTNSNIEVPSVVTTNLPRPDVAAAFASLPCQVSANSGWHLYPTAPLPVGVHYMYVHAYVPGGTFVPGSGAIQPASAYAQRFVVVLQ